MKKILQILDCEGWAIDTLAKQVVKYNPQYDWKRMFIHPKDIEQGKVNLGPIKEAMEWADLIDAHYWRTLSQLLDLIPELQTKKILLTHHNEKNILSYDWKENISHMARTEYSKKTLLDNFPDRSIGFVNNTYDPDRFQYNENYSSKEKIVGYVGRIVPWKGLKDVAKACYELDYPLMVMGKMDKPSYFAEIPKEHQAIIQWDYFNCEDKDVPEFYKNISVYVGNSGGGRETGPLGLMEAMASGVPCVTTRAGIAQDICVDNENCLLVDFDDYDELKESIQKMMETPALQARLRKNAWESIRNHNHERGALEYSKMFIKLLNDKPLVSVIIPTTHERTDQVMSILDSLEHQTYKSIEAIVVFDQSVEDSNTKELSEAVKSLYSYPITVLETNMVGGYNLSVARNLGVIQALGKYLMFCDSRLLPKSDAIEQFIKNVPEDKNVKFWLFGNKGGDKKHFVENFSLIRRKDLIIAGMFNGRINAYGAMSQELRERFAGQGFQLLYVPEAEAEQMIKSSMTPAKRNEIIKMKNLLFRLGLN